MDTPQYLYHLDQNLAMDLADPEYDMPEDWVYSGEAALQLAESGQTLWGHPGWIADWERLIRSPNPKTMDRIEAVVAQLLADCPEDWKDSELAGKLRYILGGDWAIACAGQASLWPRMSLARQVGLSIQVF